MSFRSLRTLLFVVPVFVAVGIVAACGPYGMPGTPPPSNTCPGGSSTMHPTVFCAPPPPNAQTPMPQNTYMPPPPYPSPNTASPSWNLIVQEGKLLLQTAEGARSLCEKMTILVHGVDPVQVSVSGSEIKIASGKDLADGTLLAATAQRVNRSGVDGALLGMEGNVKLLYLRKGKKAEVTADRISLNLATGQIVSDMDTQIIVPIQPVSVIVPLGPPPSPGEPHGKGTMPQ